MHDTDLIDAMGRPETYPWRPERIELVETHISWVFLAGDRVVKIKRPVAFPFVDHSTLAKRHQSCLDEVRLNRRLTDDVYLGVSPIVRHGDGFRVDGEGEPVEWATVMRRLPAEGMLDALLAANAAPSDLPELLAARLIPFHRDGAPVCDGPDMGAVALKIVTDNLAELAPFAGAPLDAVQLEIVTSAMHRFIDTHEALLRDRVAGGWIREGHGDLRSEHICLEPERVVQIFDCVEFNRDLRCADVASDLAFLLMDLGRLGARAAAVGLLDRYAAAGITFPAALLRFYGVHRALVRAKVACLARASTTEERRLGYERKAADYLHVATAAAIAAKPVLFVMTGLSGTGKSTVAHALGRALTITPISTDLVRKELGGGRGLAVTVWQEGLYSAEWTAATYTEMLARADAVLAAGRPALLDGSFLDAKWREEAARLAAARGVPCVLVETVGDPAVVRQRLMARQAEGGSPSDATVDTYERQREKVQATPPTVPRGMHHVRVDTTPVRPVALGPILRWLQHAGLLSTEIPDEAWPTRATDA